MTPSVLVLAGGPDAERPVSIESAQAVADALTQAGHQVHHQLIDTPNAQDLAKLPGDIIFPILHGLWGEGGPLQDLLEVDPRPYLGSAPRPARLAMDKVATKLIAAQHNIPTTSTAIFDPNDPVSPIALPLVLKPVREGSSVSVHMVRTQEDWQAAATAVAADINQNPGRTYLIETLIDGRELTVPLLDQSQGLQPLPIIEIKPATDFYDLDAKYTRNDTTYILDPDLPEPVQALLQTHSVALANALSLRHLARADYILDDSGTPQLLEINTMPGFTPHSLLPMAAAHIGLSMPKLCSHLANRALTDRQPS